MQISRFCANSINFARSHEHETVTFRNSVLRAIAQLLHCRTEYLGWLDAAFFPSFSSFSSSHLLNLVTASSPVRDAAIWDWSRVSSVLGVRWELPRHSGTWGSKGPGKISLPWDRSEIICPWTKTSKTVWGRDVYPVVDCICYREAVCRPGNLQCAISNV